MSDDSRIHGVGEHWRGTAGSRLFAALFTASAVASVVIAILGQNFSIVGLVLAMAVAGSLSFWSVDISERGVRAHSTYGWPRIHIPVQDITSATVVEVRALRDWAGWGLRINTKGDTGVVLRSGTALSINKKGGRRTVITARDSAHAVEVLNRIIDHSR